VICYELGDIGRTGDIGGDWRGPAAVSLDELGGFGERLHGAAGDHHGGALAGALAGHRDLRPMPVPAPVTRRASPMKRSIMRFPWVRRVIERYGTRRGATVTATSTASNAKAKPVVAPAQVYPSVTAQGIHRWRDPVGPGGGHRVDERQTDGWTQLDGGVHDASCEADLWSWNVGDKEYCGCGEGQRDPGRRATRPGSAPERYAVSRFSDISGQGSRSR
jgi:hypothetical protein